MDSFSSPPSGASSQFSTNDIMDQVKTQLEQAYAEQFLEYSGQCFVNHLNCMLGKPESMQSLITVRDKCFDKCITKPGSSLSGSEGSCISRCVDRYIEATGIISKALFSQR